MLHAYEREWKIRRVVKKEKEGKKDIERVGHRKGLWKRQKSEKGSKN